MKSLLFGLILTAALAGTLRATSAGKYTVPLFTGPRARPYFSGSGERYRIYRTAITNGLRDNPIAAGHYVIITVGCGAACRLSWVGDVRSGKILPFPVGGEDFPDMTITTTPGSRAVLARWSDETFTNCTMRLYSIDQSGITQIAADKRQRSSCPD